MNDENTTEVEYEKGKSRTDVFKEAGSSRVVASASWTILMAIVGAIMLFIYQVYAGNAYGETGGLSYFSISGAILTLAIAISIGGGQAFIKFAKEKYTVDGIEKGKDIIVQMSKINMILGIIISIIMFIIAFINISDPIFFIILLGAASGIFISFLRDILVNMFGILNRFDMSAVIGGLYGVIVCIFGFMVIFLNIPAEFLAFIPTIMISLMMIIAIYFYKQIKTVGFKDLFFAFKKYPIKKKFARKYLIYSIECAISNLVVFGIFSHIVLLMTFLSYNYWGHLLDFSVSVLNMTQILTLVDSFVFIEVAIIFFSGPLNVEVSEAYAKNDHDTMEKSINAVGRVGLIVALPISLAMVILAPDLILFFARGSVSVGSPAVLSDSLFLQTWMTLAITSFGQAFYGLACIYGSALIGSGKAKQAALGFGLAALILLITTPIFIFLLGSIDNFLPIFGVNTYSLIGTGISFLLSGLFILPYLAYKTKKLLTIKYDLRIKQMIICLMIFGVFLFFAPIEFNALLLQSLLPFIGFEILQLLSLILFLFIGILLIFITFCFFGVVGSGDGKLIKDTLDSFKLGWIANIFIKIGKFFYRLNPLNKKLNR